jgi:hypothetical protein
MARARRFLPLSDDYSSESFPHEEGDKAHSAQIHPDRGCDSSRRACHFV